MVIRVLQKIKKFENLTLILGRHGIAIKKTHTKFEDLIFKIDKVPAISRFDKFYKGIA